MSDKQAGKGDDPRPISNPEEYRKNYDIIFKRKANKIKKSKLTQNKNEHQ